MHSHYLLFAHPCSYIFTLKEQGQEWTREFTSVFDAVAYAATLPDSESATLAVFNASGNKLVELRVHDQVLPVGG